MSGIGRLLRDRSAIWPPCTRCGVLRFTRRGRPATVRAMLSALGWGALAASSLIIGGLLGLLRDWSNKIVGIVLAFGAGALISAVSFDLFEEGQRIGGAGDGGGGRRLRALPLLCLPPAGV